MAITYFDLNKKIVTYSKNFTGIKELSASNLRFWYKDGVKHREDGPAVETICFDGYKQSIEYWIFGNHVTMEEHKFLVDLLKLKGLL